MNVRLVTCVLSLTALRAFAEPVELTLEEFKLYTNYKKALNDSRVEKLKPEARLLAIAKDAKVKPKELQKAIERGEAAGDVKARCEANITEALAKTDLAGRVGRVEVDAEDAHAVAYVQWFNEKPELLVIEASTAAARAGVACPIASTITVWAHDKANPKTRLFQALISGQASAKINADKVKDYAETRYLRLFEKVKNASAGDDLSAESGTPTAHTGAP